MRLYLLIWSCQSVFDTNSQTYFFQVANLLMFLVILCPYHASHGLSAEGTLCLKSRMPELRFMMMLIWSIQNYCYVLQMATRHRLVDSLAQLGDWLKSLLATQWWIGGSGQRIFLRRSYNQCIPYFSALSLFHHSHWQTKKSELKFF